MIIGESPISTEKESTLKNSFGPDPFPLVYWDNLV